MVKEEDILNFNFFFFIYISDIFRRVLSPMKRPKHAVFLYANRRSTSLTHSAASLEYPSA